MKLEVKLFAGAREAAGADKVTLDLPPEARAGDLRAALAALFPKLAALAPRLLVAVGHEYADERAAIGQLYERERAARGPQCEIACFPPVSGG